MTLQTGVMGHASLRSQALVLCASIWTGILAAPATKGYAQEHYPARPIEFITQYSPGGIADSSIRAIEPFLSRRLGMRGNKQTVETISGQTEEGLGPP